MSEVREVPTPDGGGVAPPHGPARGAPVRRRPPLHPAAGWVVAIVAAAVAVVAFVRWSQADGASDDRRAVAETAGTVLSALTNWEADDLPAVREEVAQRATDRFRDEADAIFSEFGQNLSAAGARSEGEVLDLVAEVEGPTAEGTVTATALAVVRQVTENIDLPSPDVGCWAARLLVQQVEGRWLVDGLELYGPNACPRDLG